MSAVVLGLFALVLKLYVRMDRYRHEADTSFALAQEQKARADKVCTEQEETRWQLVAAGKALDERDNLTRQLADAERGKESMYQLVTRMEKQRDEWNAMFRSDSVKHVATAAVYDRDLLRERVRIYHLLQTLNEQREKDWLKLIKTPRHLDSELGINALPVGKVDEYVDEVKTLFTEGAPEFVAERGGKPREPDIDGVAERDKLVEWLERDSGAGA